MIIDKQLKKTLAAKAHALKPVVMLGGNGLTDSVLKEINVALEAHELIKIRVNATDREEREILIQAICEQSHSALIQKIGHVVTIYRKRK